MKSALRGETTDRPALAYLFLGGAGLRMAGTLADPAIKTDVQLAAAV